MKTFRREWKGITVESGNVRKNKVLEPVQYCGGCACGCCGCGGYGC